MKTMKKVPEIITGKDLDYLVDSFNWNYLAYKRFNDTINRITNTEMRSLIDKSIDTFYNNMTGIIDIISGGINE